VAAHAQTFPAKPVTIVLPFPPAGGADTLARILSTPLDETWKASSSATAQARAAASRTSWRKPGRSRHRMALKIIGAGFGRTGTMSLYTALNQLGMPCYHMFEVLKNPKNRKHLDFWRKVARGKEGEQHDWNAVFASYTAAVDNPACCVWRELMVAYPEAKVILTLHPRGAGTWYESTLDTIYFTENVWQFKVLEFLTPFGRKFGDMSRRLIWGRSLKGTMEDRDKAIARYEEHIAEVKAAVPPEKLLVFSVDQGWEPLCRFLGIEEPNAPFPNVNDRNEIKKEIRKIMGAAYGMVAVGVLAIALVVWGAARLSG
jgi:hypothetical protein